MPWGRGEGTVQREGEEGRGTGRETGMGEREKERERDRRERGRGTGRESKNVASIFKRSIRFVWMTVLPACMYVHCAHAWCPTKDGRWN